MRQLFERTVRLTTATRLTRSRKIAEAAKEYIEAHFPEPDLGVETIAQHLYINSSYLRSVFKKEVGMTVIDYLLLVRMNKAKELIRAGQIKLADIAEMIGYSDAGYFSKSFKKHYGLSPSEYENSIV
jgi:two-component system response regulator YesN